MAVATNSERTASSPSADWRNRMHLALTALLLVIVAGGLILAGTGRLRLGAVAVPPTEEAEAPAVEKPTPTEEQTGRYQIEKLADSISLVEQAGRLGLFGDQIHEVWAFRYKGGFLEVKLETDINGTAQSAGPLPEDWKGLLAQDEAIRTNAPGAFNKEGFILLTATRPVMTVTDALAPLHRQLGGLLSATTQSPLLAVSPLHVETIQPRPYRLFLSAEPPAKASGSGFNLWNEQVLPIRSLIIPRNPRDEAVFVSTSKNVTPGKEFLLLERQRGYSWVRLRARFLGDGEVRSLAKE